MSLTIDKKDFVGLLHKTFPMIPVRSTLQVLSNFRLVFDGSTLEAHATDLDHSIKAKTAAGGEEPFDVAVNARKLFDIARELPEGEVRIKVNENVVLIESSREFSCRIAGSEPHDFPTFPDISEKVSLKLSVPVVAQTISKSSFAVSRDDSRPSLCGVLWEVDPTKMGMVATDGHRLGSCFVSGNFGVDSKITCIVSPKSLVQVAKTMGEAQNGEMTVTIGERYVLFDNDHVQLCSKLIEGTYPDYTKAIPKENPKKAVVKRAALVEAVKRVSILASQKNNLVKFEFNPGKLELVVSNTDIGGEAREELDVDYDGENHAIGFNAHYLGEILGIIEAAEVRFEMNTQISACLLFPVFDNTEEPTTEDLFLIMPLRIVDEG